MERRGTEVNGERHWGETPQRGAPADALWTLRATEGRHSGIEERRDTEDTEDTEKRD